MQLARNNLVCYIWHDDTEIKNTIGLHCDVSISNISFNGTPEAEIKIKGLNRQFSQELVADLNIYGMVEAKYFIVIEATRSIQGKQVLKETVFIGSIVAGDIDGPPDNILSLIARVGVNYIGKFSVYSAKPNEMMSSVVKKAFQNIQDTKMSIGGNSLANFNNARGMARIAGGGSVNLSMRSPPSIIFSKDADGTVNNFTIEGTINDLLLKIQHTKPNVRYIWNIRGNSLSFQTIGKPEKVHIIESRQILQAINLSEGIYNIKIKSFFNEFARIYVGDGIKVKSNVKRYLNYLYQVVGINIELSNKDNNKWFMTLDCVLIGKG